MNIRMKGVQRDSGFSLIEVLVAVVILATGLLALTALQGRLAQSSADAKVRSRVASLLTSRMDELRAGQYTNIPPAAGSASATFTATCAGGAAWVCDAESESKASGLSVVHTYARFMDVGGTFTNSGAAAPSLATAEFKRITLTATWTDAAGSDRSLAVSTDVSPLSLTATRFQPAPGGAGSGGKAVVRQDSPEENGVIPIALGNGEDTAATNPKPVVGSTTSTVLSTNFNVLTYKADEQAGVRVQDRVETSVVGCKCTYGNVPTGIWAQSYRPTYWDGNRYVSPDKSKIAAVTGPATIAKKDPEQSALCTDCCRDHRDADTDDVKFDRTRAQHLHYSSADLTVSVTSGDYSEACRLIRVDGFWRVATDLRIRHFDYIGSANPGASPTVVAVEQAPAATYKAKYQDFVKDYLAKAYVAKSGPDPYSLYSLAGAKPNYVELYPSGSPSRWFQHTHAVLVDDIEAQAATAMANASNCTKPNKADCVLPHLPFSTINLTELASYLSANPSAVSVSNSSWVAEAASVGDTIMEGLVTALSSAAAGITKTTANADIKLSNTGLMAVVPIDPDDATKSPVALNTYWVNKGGSPTTSAESITVSIDPVLLVMNDGNSSNDPVLAPSTAGDSCDAASLLTTNPYTCKKSSGFGSGTNWLVNFSKYNFDAGQKDKADIPGLITAQCTKNGNNPKPYNLSSGDKVNVCKNYAVASSADYNIGSIVGSGTSQTTQITFTNVKGGQSRTIKLEAQPDTYSYTCTYTGSGAPFTVAPKPCP